MATDSGTAKARETSEDNSSVRREVRDNSFSISRDHISNQKDNSIPVQTQNPSNMGARDLSSIPAQKDNPASVGRNSSAASQSNPPSSAQRDSSAATRNSSTSDNPVSVPVNPQDNRLHSKLNNKVANRAYELYQRNGANHGDDLFHWLQAESEILTRIPEIRQTESSFSVIVPLEGFTPEEISVVVASNRALILADKQQASNSNDSQGSQISCKSAFFITDWPDEVELSTATSQLKQGNLVLTVKRANGTSQNAKAAEQ